MKNAVFACMIFVASGSLYAVDFIRGDVNGDGVVSIADAYILFHYQERRSEIDTAIPRPVQCLDAADVDDNGFVDEIDYALIWGFASSTYPWLPEPPFPNAGRDPTTEEDLTCDSYGGGSRLRDPAAKLEIFHAYAPGGKNGHVVITVAVSSSTSIAAFQGKVLDHRGILADSGFLSVGFLGNTSGRIPGILDDLTGPFIKPWDSRSRQYRSIVPSAEVSQGRLGFSYIRVYDFAPRSILHVDRETVIPPNEHFPVINILLCLKPGTPAGDYPLTFESGELVDADSGKAIETRLVSGILTVEADVEDTACVVDPNNPPPSRPNVVFKLEDSSGPPGGKVTVPFSIRADRASQGFSFSVDFDEGVLQVDAAKPFEKLWNRPTGTPYDFLTFEFNNDDLVPGNAGADEGFLVGAAVITLTDNSDVLPPNRETPVLEFHFVVREDAPIGSTELRFLDGGQVSGGSVQNKLIAEGSDITPELANSFVFVNGLIQILGDVTAFIRGDSNGDGKVDISDPITTLNFLFLGARQPACFDAADANDDGEVDVSDGIATFNYLYVGDRVLPPPNGVPGTDPTPDSLGCLFRNQ